MTIDKENPSYKTFCRYYAEKKLPLVLVVGSGLSASGGIKAWSKLRDFMLEQAERHVSGLSAVGEAMGRRKLQTAKDPATDHWVCFKILREVLTPALYVNLMVQELTAADRIAIPEAYNEIMRLSPSGVVSLNLDRFAGEALGKANPGKLVTPVYGKELCQRWEAIRSASCFFVQLHGTLLDDSTWVFTHDELQQVLSSKAHEYFLADLYLYKLVLFLGVSADDVALSGRLVALKQEGFGPRSLFWLTTRKDEKTERWAAENSVMIIPYAADHHKEHLGAIKALVSSCVSQVEKDELLPPRVNLELVSQHPAPLIEPTPEEVEALAHNEIRIILNSILSSRLVGAQSNEQKLRVFRDFCSSYSAALHKSFFRDDKPGKDRWFDYKISFPPLGTGNFGNVYIATKDDSPDNLVAVKIMRQSKLTNDDMLGGFRRGIAAMDILKRNMVRGMVPIHESYEIPPTVVMEYVQGVNLESVISWGKWSWITKLKAACRVGDIVASGHRLAETVLHRDLKPSNIMVIDMDYERESDPEVRVLDFDMCWFKGSEENDIVFEERTEFGYLAPEQTVAFGRGISQRSTRVDSYGLGMTLYALFSGKQPIPNEGLKPGWLEQLKSAVRWQYDGDWASAPYRLARLIARLTEFDQERRLDFMPAVRQLNELLEAALSADSVRSTSLVAEECLARIDNASGYEWDDGRECGYVASPGGVRLEAQGELARDRVQVTVSFADSGTSDRGKLSVKLRGALIDMRKEFEKNGWLVERDTLVSGHAILRANTSRTQLLEDKWRSFGACGKAFDLFADIG